MLKTALKIFIQVCKSGSFTKAAAKLYVTPSAVMQQMDALWRRSILSDCFTGRIMVSFLLRQVSFYWKRPRRCFAAPQKSGHA